MTSRRCSGICSSGAFLAGVDLGRFAADDAGIVLFAVTERIRVRSLDRFVEEVSAL